MLSFNFSPSFCIQRLQHISEVRWVVNSHCSTVRRYAALQVWKSPLPLPVSIMDQGYSAYTKVKLIANLYLVFTIYQALC